ncbi:MAG: trypsin-like peptidase domain-containing protein [bacterium]|nr:trypsin-like peptidase domain-containing protein [bacterium]
MQVTNDTRRGFRSDAIDRWRGPTLAMLLIPLAALIATQTAAVGQERRPQPNLSKPGVSERGSVLEVVEPEAGELELRMTPVVRAVPRAADSVVSIYLRNQTTLANRQPVTQGQGSGVLLDPSGLVITNWHVIWPLVESRVDARELTAEVKLRDGRARPAAVLSHSKTHDLALLQIQLQGDEKVKPIAIGRSGDLMIGETLIAIGNPQGHANTVTTGVLSAVGRSIKVRAPDGSARSFTNLMQTDAAINQGNSGGALLDITGKLVGINNAMAVGAENIGFAIPMDIVREVFENELTQSGSFATALDAPWLGLEVTKRDQAIMVSSVLVGSPADQAGIEPGDLLTQVQGRAIRGSLDYQRQLVSASPDEPITLNLRRGTREFEVRPVPTTRTDWYVLRALGCELENVTRDSDRDAVTRATLAFYRGTTRRRVSLLQGTLRVKAVEPGSPADGLLQPGDLLFAYVVRNRLGEFERPLLDRNELHEELRERYGRSIKLAVARQERDFYTTIEVRAINRSGRRDD